MQSTLRERLEQFSHLNQTTFFQHLERQVGALSAFQCSRRPDPD